MWYSIFLGLDQGSANIFAEGSTGKYFWLNDHKVSDGIPQFCYYSTKVAITHINEFMAAFQYNFIYKQMSYIIKFSDPWSRILKIYYYICQLSAEIK